MPYENGCDALKVIAEAWIIEIVRDVNDQHDNLSH